VQYHKIDLFITWDKITARFNGLEESLYAWN